MTPDFARGQQMFGELAKRQDRFTEIAIMVLRVIAWFYLVGGVLAALLYCFAGTAATSLFNSYNYYGGSSFSVLTACLTIFVMLFIMLSAVSGWALFIGLASIVENLIAIRKATPELAAGPPPVVPPA